MREGRNPARWSGHFKEAMVGSEKMKPKHLPAMPYNQIPAFINRLHKLGSISALALEFTILTAARSGETLGALWSEVDVENALWSIPAERMKNGFPHSVPLTWRLGKREHLANAVSANAKLPGNLSSAKSVLIMRAPHS